MQLRWEWEGMGGMGGTGGRKCGVEMMHIQYYCMKFSKNNNK